MKRLVLPLVILLLGAQLAAAQTFSVQGVLRNPQGRTVADGSYSLTFRLYTAATGGSAVWTETQGSVPVQHGVFGAELGAVTSLASLPFNSTYWLGIAVASGAEMEPRIKLAATPYTLSVLGTGNRFPSSGNVGIGTTSPGFRLRVVGDGTNATAFTSGKVGIGNTAPSNPLTVTGNADITGNLAIGTASPSNRLTVAGNGDITGNLGIGTNAPRYLLDMGPGLGQKLAVYQSAAGDAFYGFGISSGTLEIHASSANTSAPPRMVVKNDGNVGIGTGTPSERLTVQGNIKLNTGALIFPDGSSFTTAQMGGTASGVNNTGTASISGTTGIELRTNSAARLNVTQAGNVGIGTAAPQLSLDVQGHVLLSTPAGQPDRILRFSRGTGWSEFWDVRPYWDSNYLKIGYNEGSLLVLGEDGRVGIGTTTPQATLDVWGTVINRGMDFVLGNADNGRGDSGASRALVKDNGALLHINYAGDFTGGTFINGSKVWTATNLGVGTDTPLGKLDVRGGNGSGDFTNTQIALQYWGNGYRHSIRTRHNSAVTAQNAIDF
ncbi:MAG: hypothetical protein AB1505_15760 [Candidatus Latescibacterota bacterium]